MRSIPSNSQAQINHGSR